MAHITLIALALIFLVLGTTGVVFPRTTRRFINLFVHRAPTRVLGCAVLVAGALLFRYSDSAAVPLLAKILGFVMFVAGGTQIIIPDLAIVFNEWWVEQRPLYERGVSVVYLSLAVFFIVSVSPAAYVDAAGARLKPIYEEIAASYSLVFGRRPEFPAEPLSPEERERIRKAWQEKIESAQNNGEVEVKDEAEKGKSENDAGSRDPTGVQEETAEAASGQSP